MLKHNCVHASHHQTLILSHNPILSSSSVSYHKRNSIPTKSSRKFPTLVRRWRSSLAGSVKAISSVVPSTYTIKVQVFVSADANEELQDKLLDAFGKSIHIDLVAANLDPKTKEKKPFVGGYVQKQGSSKGINQYEANFTVPRDFGVIGAVLVQNEHSKEIFVKNVVLSGESIGKNVGFSCESWVQPKDSYNDKDSKRVFFNNTSFLPSQTPDGLKSYREEELKVIRTEDHRERKPSDRIYDYDVYNDLGDPDTNKALRRPVLGGSTHPYPRRCRTGRPMCITDPHSETRSNYVYVPRDETFSAVMQATFLRNTQQALLHGLIPRLEATIDGNHGFPNFTAIDNLFNEGLSLQNFPTESILHDIIPSIVKSLGDDVLKFEMPRPMDRDKFFWLRDSEFGRQTLAGLNPCCIKLVTEWPIKSGLDPAVYGPAESAITKEIVEEEIGGIMTVQEAIYQKKLFILDYYDLFLPFVSKVRALEGTTLYGSRTLFFLTPEGTLQTLAIELARPPMDGKPQWREVYVECSDATGSWLWRLAKAHVRAHDLGFHQLYSHKLRTHDSTEPYIIASHRHLSAMHPIYRLLHPHFRFTMEINANARQKLTNAGGVIESTFFPGKYSMLVNSAFYHSLWRFDREGLPADLIHRGMAVEDPDGPHGLKLTIEDYPYAADGLLIWDAIKEWVKDYVTHYYEDDKSVKHDTELQAWWYEIRHVGHGDKKDEKWWPELNTPNDLISILTTMIWIASGHHAAVNFSQYDYAGYFPNRATMARTNMPNEDPTEAQWEKFLERPEDVLLENLPTQIQAVTMMATMDILSAHPPDEEYIGMNIEPSYKDDDIIKAKFEMFSGRLKQIEGRIDERNANRRLLNRCGAGVIPYQLLKPYSEPGVTGKGVPNSISM